MRGKERADARERAILERVAEMASVAVVQLDSDGQIVYCSAVAQKVLGLARIEDGHRRYDAPEWRITDLDGNPFPAEDLPFSRVMKTGRSVQDVRHAIETFGGKRVLLRVNAAPLLDADGAVDGVVATLGDITEQITTERSLARRVELEKLLLAATTRLLEASRDETDAAIESVMRDVARFVGAKAAIIVGTGRESGLRYEWCDRGTQPQGREALDVFRRVLTILSESCAAGGRFVAPTLDALPASAAATRSLLEAASVASLALVSVRHRERQLGVFGVAACGQAAPWNDDTLTQLAMAANSLAAAVAGKLSEEALVTSEERAARLVAASPMGIHMYDLTPDGRLVFAGANRAADRILGVDNRQFVGRTIEEAFPPLAGTEVPVRYRRAAEAGEVWQTQQIDYRDEAIVGAFEVLAFQTQPGSMAALFLDITERRRAEEALRQSEARLKSILHVAPAGIGLVRQRVFLEVNERICELTGYSAEELVGQSARMLYPTQEEFELVGREKYRQIDERGYGSVETVWRRKDGGLRDVLLSSAPLDPTDRDSGVTFTALDITERKLGERLTKTQLDLLRAASSNLGLAAVLTLCLDAALDLGELDAGGVYVVDRDDESLRLLCARGVSQAFAERVRLVPRADPRHAVVMAGQSTYMTWEDVAPLGDGGAGEGIRALAILPLVDHGKVLGCLNAAARSRDSIVPRARTALETIASLAGGVVARAQAEEALRRSEAKQHEFLRNFQGIVYMAERPGHALSLLDGLVRQITGYSREAFLSEGLSWGDLVHPEDHARWQAAMAAMGTPGGPAAVDVEYRILHKDGDVRWVRDVAHGLATATQGGPDVHGAIYDVTERRRAEQAQRELEAQVRQQQRLESIGTLAAGVAHEVNNPLNGILNYGQLIANRTDPESAPHRWALSIVRESERVTEIVRNLLSFSRHEKQAHSPARMEDVVGATLGLVSALFRKDQITIASRVQDGLPPLKCRSQQIQQVLLNLLTNARDALNERFPEHDPRKAIAIEVEAVERDGRRWIRTSVADQGAGIDPTIADRLFDPFFTTKPRDVGTGLGLAVSYGIVKAHHGTLTFESRPNQGARFFLELPVDNGWDLGGDAAASGAGQ